ncbi:MAG: hypothetical protein PW786_13865 [Arachidicoccus sp.]|nr:hypothetical protein [Arachidicoccus sp.]
MLHYRQVINTLYKINSTTIKAIVKEITYKLDVNTLEKIEANNIQLNDIVRVKIKVAHPFVFDPYKKLNIGGGFVLIDETSCLTVAAGMVQ